MTLYLISDEIKFTEASACLFGGWEVWQRRELLDAFRQTMTLHVHHADASIIELKTVSHAAFAIGQQVSLSVNGAAHVFSQ